MQGGIFADECNNVFVGFTNGTIKVYKFNGSVFDDAAAADIHITGFGGNSIYDIAYNHGNNQIYACGDGFVTRFTLFDNAYVAGTNSADGHAWCTQSIANDYLEHFYVGYSRTYPDDGDCAMAISNGGCLWDAALKKGKSVRVWGEFCDDSSAKIEPEPKDWFKPDTYDALAKGWAVAHPLAGVRLSPGMVLVPGPRDAAEVEIVAGIAAASHQYAATG